jgi:hypothetical protein
MTFQHFRLTNLQTFQIQVQFAHRKEPAERFIAVLCKVPPKLLETYWTLSFSATNQITTRGTIQHITKEFFRYFHGLITTRICDFLIYEHQWLLIAEYQCRSMDS